MRVAAFAAPKGLRPRRRGADLARPWFRTRPRPRCRCTAFVFEDEDDDEDDLNTLLKANHDSRPYCYPVTLNSSFLQSVTSDQRPETRDKLTPETLSTLNP
jgi:hypothetical protein